MNLYLGGPIWAYKEWVGSFYPPGTKASDYLQEYTRRLTTVEGNTTFYAVPSAETLQSWAATMPPTFRFCPKLPRAISHAGKLSGKIAQAQQFCAVLSQLGINLGPMFLQLPPRYPPDWLDDLESFLNAWPPQVQLAVEVRHLGWFDAAHNENLNELLCKHDMARVVIDTRPIRSLQGDRILAGSVYQRLLAARQRKPDLPILPERTASFIFLRYIGHPQIDLNNPYMEEWASQLAKWLQGGAEAYVFCHCPDERLDPWLCRELHRKVAEIIALPPLPWEEAEAGTARQASFF
ncbi:MAG: DUF72 domain-containing protein [Anaerolineales bacterium]|nr:MAG: DUF72 domain-containing protein [Anaerolineales bacterium]